MFKEKVITITIFDPDIFKIGTKVHAKYRPAIGHDYEYWEHDFIGNIRYYDEDVIGIEDPNDLTFNIFNDEPHARRFGINIEDVQIGFWVFELLE